MMSVCAQVICGDAVAASAAVKIANKVQMWEYISAYIVLSGLKKVVIVTHRIVDPDTVVTVT